MVRALLTAQKSPILTAFGHPGKRRRSAAAGLSESSGNSATGSPASVEARWRDSRRPCTGVPSSGALHWRAAPHCLAPRFSPPGRRLCLRRSRSPP